MTLNRSSNKIRVTRLFGAGETSGFIDPQVNMQVHTGIDARWIVALQSGNYTVSLALASGGPVKAKQYPLYLTIDQPQASSYFGWPNNTGSTIFGHHSTPLGIGSGEVYQGGDGQTHLFSRAPDFPG